MKAKIKTALSITSGLILFTSTGLASIVINGEYGQLRNSDGSVVMTTTLWAIIYDADNNGVLPGGLAENQSLNDSNILAAGNDFSGVTIDLNAMIAGDKVIAFGLGTDPDGAFAPIVSLTNGVPPSGSIYAFYWFPGIAQLGNPIPAVFEIGGINETQNFLGAIGMKIPADGATVNTAIFDEELGGALPTTRFTAIAVPEPATVALSALGLMALLRRRR